MAMTSCRECGHAISTTAKSCPKCGARVSRSGWLLWIPTSLIALIVAFVLYGLTVPEYVHEARERRAVCEQMLGPFRREECRRIHDSEISAGRTLAQQKPGYIAPADRKLAADAERVRLAEDAAMLKDCQLSIARKRADYDRLMRAKAYWDASLAIRRCSELQPENAALKELVAIAEQKQYISEIEDRSLERGVRVRALEALMRDYPDVGQKYSKLLGL